MANERDDDELLDTDIGEDAGDDELIDVGDDDESAGMTDADPTTTGTAAGTRITDDDVGKDVLDAGGEKIGIVAGVEGQHVHVDPDPGITDRIKTALGWGDVDDEDTYMIQQEYVSEVTGDAIRLRQM